MRIAVMGAGGIGAYLAALLSRAGHEVAVICRGRHLEAIRTAGLRVLKEGAMLQVPRLLATSHPAEVGVVDVIIVAVKLYDLAQAAAEMAPMVGPQTMVVPIQNGVNSHEIINAALGGPYAAGGTVFISASIIEPGVVAARGQTDRLIFGEIDSTISPRVRAFQQACQASGIDAVASPAILRDMWEKFAVIAGTSAVCCLARQSVGYVCADPALSRLILQGMWEAMSVARALDIEVADDTDRKGFAFNQSVAYGTRVSMLEDIENGKRTELPWLSGHLVHEAARLGMDVPLHTVAYACLSSQGKHPMPSSVA